MSTDYRIRQRDIIPEDKLNVRVGIIGCGAIGSHTATALAQMGIKHFFLIDPDTVSSENMSSQGFYPSDINERKVDVIAKRIREINPASHVDYHCEKFDPIFVLQNSFGLSFDILITAVDNMETRAYANQFCMSQKTEYLIDPRMGAEILTMATVDYTEDIEWYQHTLHSDENSVQERCTAKATIYTALMASALVCKAVKDIITNNNYTEYLTWNIKANQMIDYTVKEIMNEN